MIDAHSQRQVRKSDDAETPEYCTERHNCSLIEQTPNSTKRARAPISRRYREDERELPVTDNSHKELKAHGKLTSAREDMSSSQ